LVSELEAYSLLVFSMAVYGMAHGIRAVAEWTFLIENTPTTLRTPISAYSETLLNVGDFLERSLQVRFL